MPRCDMAALAEERLLRDSIRSLFDPCGSWQVEQLSVTGKCSQSIGPRFSAWQLTHDSLTVRRPSAA